MPILADYAMQLQRTFRVPYPRLTQRYVWRNNAIKTAMVALEIGHLIRYKNTALGIKASYQDDWWYVESIEHTLTVGQTPATMVTLVPSYLYRNLDKIAWDNFDRADAVGSLGITPSGDDWAGDSGFNIVGGKARPNTVLPQFARFDLAVADMTVEVYLANLAIAEDIGITGLVYRYADANNYWALRLLTEAGGPWVQLRKRTTAGGIITVVDTSYPRENTGDLRVIVQGSRHRAYYNGGLLIDTVDGDLSTNTIVGMYAEGTILVTFDDFYAQGL